MSLPPINRGSRNWLELCATPEPNSRRSQACGQNQRDSKQAILPILGCPTTPRCLINPRGGVGRGGEGRGGVSIANRPRRKEEDSTERCGAIFQHRYANAPALPVRLVGRRGIQLRVSRKRPMAAAAFSRSGRYLSMIVGPS